MKALAADLRHWMFEEALPFWGTAGVDRRHGGFVEHFTLEGVPHTDSKRVFVVCRQIYVFAQAAEMGWAEGAALYDHGWRFLQKARLEEGGWARRLDRDGRPTDTTADLYTLAFVLFACAWVHRLSGDKSALAAARATLAFVETALGHPAGGYLHEHAATGPRQQNPHMHLVEGLLALADTSGDGLFLDAARKVVDLFATRLYDPAAQVLPEFFAADWSRLPGEEGRLTEPGHQFEWAWILAHYRRLSGHDLRAVIAGLHAGAECHGVDPATRVTYNGVRDDGRVLDAGSRIWPNTERMKAAVALHEVAGRPPGRDLAESGRLLLDRYLRPPPLCWIDTRDAAGRPAATKVPASSLYHLVLAFAETLRIVPTLAADAA